MTYILFGQCQTGTDLKPRGEDFSTRKGISLIAVLTLLCLPVDNGQAQSASGYLETLKDEASGLKIDSKSAADETTEDRSSRLQDQGLAKDHAGAIEELETGLTIEQFAIRLKHNYIGSYLFFRRLNEEQQSEVFAFYQQNPNPQKIREKILQVSKQ